jgi:predicted phosphoadenosine phosphosulfate sulfurtransferase
MMRQRTLGVDVVTAARARIRQIFSNGLPVYLSFSGGKDSLVLAHLTMTLIGQRLIDPAMLRVEFIDEEAIFPCIESVVTHWRGKFLAVGAQFAWYCLEVKHYSCLNLLENDESFICWDRTKKAVWVRDPPAFAVRAHPRLIPRIDSYQQFLARLSDGLHMTGVRASESLQRLSAISTTNASGISVAQSSIHPIYDWSDTDVWHYLGEHEIAIPDAYVFLYQIGTPHKNLRISQFFSIDTVSSLSRMAQFYPGLMERILQREPAAYLVSLYWNSEMFRRRSATRRQIDAQQDVAEIDQRQRLLDLLANPPESVLRNKVALRTLGSYRRMILKLGDMMSPEHCRIACDALTTGDPKERVKRALITSIVSGHAKAIPGHAGSAV